MSILKLKSFLTVLLTFLAVQGFSQTVTVSGSVATGGNGVSGVLVHAATNTNYSTSVTNAQGNYSISFANAGSQGYLLVWLMDCDSSSIHDTLYYNPSNYNQTHDFNYCANPGGGTGGGGGTLTCDASFGHFDTNGTVSFFPVFPNTSTTYSWDFGDGNTSTAQSPMHTYAQNGQYLVCLTIFDSAQNCTDTFCDSVMVGSPVQTNCSAYWGFIMGTNDVTYSPFNPIAGASYHWDFGDGNTSSLENPTHQYTQNGTYTVCLTITDSSQNCTDTYCAQMYISNTGSGTGSGNCDASFTYVDSNGVVYFIPTSPSAGMNYSWSFGDGGTSYQAYPMHQYNQMGVYTVCLTIYDSTLNCTDTYCDSLYVNPAGGGGGGGGTGNCDATFFTYDSIGVQSFFPLIYSNSLNYFWDFGDGNTSTAVSPFHTYAQNGTYTACLTISDSLQNCFDTFCATITINNTGGGGFGGSIIGNVFTNNTPVGNNDATVYLIVQDSTPLGNVLIGIDSTVVDSNGFYYFFNVPQGLYYVKAALNSSSPDYNNYLPTYHDSSLYWANANLVAPSIGAINFDIHMIGGANVGGPGFIGGLVSQGANKTGAAGDPIENALVILLDGNQNPIKYTYSDAAGKFEFDQIPLGSYTVYTEVAGIPTNPVAVTIDQASDSEDRVVIKINSNGVDGFIDTTSSIADLTAASVSAFPNPMLDELNINTGIAQGNLEISVYDVTGKVVEKQVIEANGQSIRMDVSSMPKGMYILNIKGLEFEKSIKLIK